MKMHKLFVILLALIAAHDAAAYGSSGSSKKACKPPKFTQFDPPHLSGVGPEAVFSFAASHNTLPDSIRVSVKNQPVDITLTEKHRKYIITGKLPASVSDGHARINIEATTASQCKGSGGWLLKVENN